jgi:hypothetical protein
MIVPCWMVNKNGKIMTTHWQYRVNKAHIHYIELKRLHDIERLEAIALFDRLPTDIQRYVVHPFLKPDEREDLPIYEYEEEPN